MNSMYQYYPTGAHTALKMARKLTRPINHICDPSAGKGHILKHFEDGFVGVSDEHFIEFADEITQGDINRRPWGMNAARMRWSASNVEKSAIEIDISHHSSLRELNCKILGYDFLEVQSLATVSTIVMNPPFAQGAEHVLHAWKCLYDGEIVAIINAQSIKNPCSPAKRLLVDIIDKYGSVEFHTDEFVDDVERRTEVEIALIHLDKAPEEINALSDFIESLNKGDSLGSVEQVNPETLQALAIPTNFIENTYYNFKAAVSAARVLAEASAIAERASDNLGISLQEMQAKGVGSNFRKAKVIGARETARKIFAKEYKDIKRKAWGQIIRSAAINDKLSNQAKRKVEAQAETIYELDFTIANVHGFIAGILESLGDVYSQMVLDVFDNIMGRSNENIMFYRSWKSNERHKNLGMRIKRTRFILPGFKTWSSGALQYESESVLSDIDKICGFLDGKTGPIDGLVNAFKKNRVEFGTRYSTQYFDFRMYMSGTIHFFPRDVEVVERLNRFVGRARQWLPPDLNEASADFITQYDQAEKMQKDYSDAFNKVWHSHINMGYQLLSSRNWNDYERGVQAFSDVVSEVQESKGIFAGNNLQSEPKQQLLLGIA